MKQRATAIAIAAVMVAAGFSIAPSVQAGHTDCHEDFEIADSQLLANDRKLAPGESEIGVEDADTSTGNKNVKVLLTTDDQKLNVTIREDTDGGCQTSSNVSPEDCEDTFVLDTTGTNTEDSMTCTIEAPSSDSRNFYFEFLHPDTGGADLTYRAYVVT